MEPNNLHKVTHIEKRYKQNKQSFKRQRSSKGSSTEKARQWKRADGVTVFELFGGKNFLKVKKIGDLLSRNKLC